MAEEANPKDSQRRTADVQSSETPNAEKEKPMPQKRHFEAGDDEQLRLQQEHYRVNAPNTNVDDIVANICSGDVIKEFIGVRAANNILCKQNIDTIDIFINADGVLSKLVEFLGRQNDSKLQDEAALALGTIASGTSEQTKAVAGTPGAVANFIALVESSNPLVAVEAAWALGNIAGASPELRDYVIEQGIIEPLLNWIKPDTATSFLKCVTWTIFNLCRHKDPRPSVRVVRQLLPALTNLIDRYTDEEEILAGACWALSQLADGPKESIQHVIDADVVPRLVALLGHPDDEVVSPALLAIGNIAAGSDAQTDCVLAAGACPLLVKLLQHSNTTIVREAAWTVSNVAAGNASHVEALVANEVILPLIHVLGKGDVKSKKEAVWAVANMTRNGNFEQIVTLCHSGVIRPMCNLVFDVSTDPGTILVVLDGLEIILAAAEKAGVLENSSRHIEHCPGLDRIENLKKYHSDAIYFKARGILERYFSSFLSEGN